MSHLRYVIYQEDGAYLAQCLDYEIATEGDTRDEARANLQEAVELYFDGTTPALQESNTHYEFGELEVHA